MDGPPKRIEIDIDGGATLAEAVAEAEAGAEVVLTRDGRPVATLAPQPPRRSLIGGMEGQIWMSDDFDEPLDDFKEYM